MIRSNSLTVGILLSFTFFVQTALHREGANLVTGLVPFIVPLETLALAEWAVMPVNAVTPLGHKIPLRVLPAIAMAACQCSNTG